MIKDINEFPQEVNSWIILSEDVFVKRMDKSTFLHKGTGIPKKIQNLWDISDMKSTNNRKLKLIYNDIHFEAKIDCDEKGRTRLFWYSDLKNVIYEKYMELAVLYKNDQTVDKSPQMFFKKIKKNSYEIKFVDVIKYEDYVQESESDYSTNGSEGKTYYVFNKKYERDPKLRNLAIKKHGLKCSVCNFIFEVKYGEIGKGFIEIHHKKPLYINDFEVEVNVDKDLVPVCSNCHRMIHRKRNYCFEYR